MRAPGRQGQRLEGLQLVRSAAVPVLDSRPMRLCCALLIAGYAAILAGGRFFHLGDFSMFWAAGRLAAAGHAAAAYDWTAIRQMQPFGGGAFFYPPLFLLALVPFGMLAFPVAAIAWALATLAIYLAAMRRVLPGATALFAALAAPPVLFNLMLGQVDLLLAGLFAGALAVLDSQPVAAGVLIGMMACKPHFGVLLPLFLAVTGRWRVFASASLTVAALALLALLLFGAAPYAAFARMLAAANGALSHRGSLAEWWSWTNLESLLGVLHMLGVGGAAAWWGQVAFAAATAAAALWFAAGGAPDDRKFAALAVAVFLVPPYSTPWDLAMLTVAFAFLARDFLANGSRRWERILLAAAYLFPLVDFAVRVAVDRSGIKGYGWLGGPVICGALALVMAAREMPPRRQPDLRLEQA